MASPAVHSVATLTETKSVSPSAGPAVNPRASPNIFRRCKGSYVREENGAPAARAMGAHGGAPTVKGEGHLDMLLSHHSVGVPRLPGSDDSAGLVQKASAAPGAKASPETRPQSVRYLPCRPLAPGHPGSPAPVPSSELPPHRVPRKKSRGLRSLLMRPVLCRRRSHPLSQCLVHIWGEATLSPSATPWSGGGPLPISTSSLGQLKGNVTDMCPRPMTRGRMPALGTTFQESVSDVPVCPEEGIGPR
ncbi:hypothetical protein DPEC_G00021180 [Dallia pectoralis]|uniref:Uncharacterized protein n=1 Tax=Dallia pectoralis TaxID=75939 RepID=A0ACC2HG61_DALPE|nr:hypothetical protein DPEC_G00021180 [Dallia pectoralis]